MTDVDRLVEALEAVIKRRPPVTVREAARLFHKPWHWVGNQIARGRIRTFTPRGHIYPQRIARAEIERVKRELLKAK